MAVDILWVETLTAWYVVIMRVIQGAFEWKEA